MLKNKESWTTDEYWENDEFWKNDVSRRYDGF